MDIFENNNFFNRIVKQNAVLKLFKKEKHIPYVIELDGKIPVFIDLLETLVSLANKIKSPNSEVKQKLCDLICLILASQTGEADKMVEELIIRNETKDLDIKFRALINKETRPKS
jgi:hypothetical protein